MAGIAGEQLVATELGRALDDDWTLLRGYRNRRGEIDQLLLGPRGLFAIEVKNLNATVHVDGDRWRADKYDNYGNLVEQRPVADRMGRSPSVQLNEPADDLERFLARARPAGRDPAGGHPRPPAVRRSAASGTRPSWPSPRPADLLTLIGNSASRLDRGQRAAIARPDPARPRVPRPGAAAPARARPGSLGHRVDQP